MAFDITYNGLSLSEANGFFIDRELSGLDGVESRTSEEVLTGGHGVIIYGQKRAARIIRISGHTFKPDVDDYFSAYEDLVEAFSITENIELLVTRWDTAGTQRAINAYVMNGARLPKSADTADYNEFDILLKAPDPDFTDPTATEYSTELKSGGGADIDTETTIPFDIGAGTGGGFDIVNAGSVPRYAKFTIEDQISNVRVTNGATGEYFEIVSVADGITLTIEWTRKDGLTIVDNNGVDRTTQFSGTFFKVGVGTIPIFFEGTSSGSPTLTAYFKQGFLNW